MNKTDWNGMFPEVPEDFHAAVLRGLNSQSHWSESERRTSMRKKPKAYLLLAAVILICSIGAVAAVVSQWNLEAARRFEADRQQQEALVSAGAAALPQQSAEANGLTVTALQTLGDQNGVYILLGVQPPEGMALSDTHAFGGTEITLDGSNALNWSGGFTSADDGSGRWYYEIWLNNAGGEDWEGKTLAVTFTDLLEDRGKLEFTTALEGVWSLSWPLADSGQARTLASGFTGLVNGREVEVRSIELSPLSMTIRLGGEGLSQLAENADLEHLGTLFAPSLAMADGSAFEAFGGPGHEGWEASDYSYTCVFDKVLDVERAAALTLIFPNESGENALTIPLS